MEGTADQCEAWAEGTSRQTPRSTHRCTQPFTPFGTVWRLGAALWRRLIAPLGLPFSASCVAKWYRCRPVHHLLCWSHRLSPQPSDGSAPAGVLAETNKALHTVRVAFRIGSAVALRGRRVYAGRSNRQRTTLTLYFAPPPVHSSPLCLFTSPNFALDFAGILSVNGKRCWSL